MTSYVTLKVKAGHISLQCDTPIQREILSLLPLPLPLLLLLLLLLLPNSSCLLLCYGKSSPLRWDPAEIRRQFPWREGSRRGQLKPTIRTEIKVISQESKKLQQDHRACNRSIDVTTGIKHMKTVMSDISTGTNQVTTPSTSSFPSATMSKALLHQLSPLPPHPSMPLSPPLPLLPPPSRRTPPAKEALLTLLYTTPESCRASITYESIMTSLYSSTTLLPPSTEVCGHEQLLFPSAAPGRRISLSLVRWKTCWIESEHGRSLRADRELSY